MARLKWAKMLRAVASTKNEQGRVLIRRLPARLPLRPLYWKTYSLRLRTPETYNLTGHSNLLNRQ